MRVHTFFATRPKHLEKIQSLAQQELNAQELNIIYFCTSDEAVKLFDTLANRLNKLNEPEEKVYKGYRVKVNYNPVEKWDVESRRDGIVKAIMNKVKK